MESSGAAFERWLERLDSALAGGRLAEATAISARLLAGRDLKQADECRVSEKLVAIKIRSGDYEEASVLLEQLTSIAGDIGDRALTGRCHLSAGTLHMRKGDYGDAEEHYRAAAYLFKWEAIDRSWLARCYNNLGILLKARGRWRESLDFFERALEASPGMEAPEIACAILLNRCILHRKMGLIQDAWEGCRRGTMGARDAGLELARCRYSLEASTICLLRKEPTRAREYCEEALSAAMELGYGRETAIGLELVGDVHAAGDDLGKSLECYERALGIASDLAEHGDLVIEIMRRIASVKLRWGKWSEALSDIRHAVDVARAAGDIWELGVALRVMGQIHLAGDEIGLATNSLTESISVLRDLSTDSYELGISEYNLGRVLLRRGCVGDLSRSRDHLLRSRQVFGSLGWGDKVDEVDAVLAEIERDHGLFIGSGPGLRNRDEEEIAGKYGIDLAAHGIVTSDERIAGDIARWAGTDVRVLVEGETGVGKELVARTLHALGCRHEGPFVPVDCGCLFESLANSELFGHRKGAFTGAISERTGLVESADGGTLFLDEVGELSEAVQVKLLRVLEEGVVRRVGGNKRRPVDARIISATTRDLRQEVQAGRFRRDLYYRLKGVLVRIPALRERPADVGLLLNHFMTLYCDKYGKRLRVAAPAMSMLREHSWPGNVRELMHTIEALVLSSPENGVIDAGLVETFITDSVTADGLQKRVADAEQVEITRALAACDGNKTRAARMLGISRKTLYRKINLGH